MKPQIYKRAPLCVHLGAIVWLATFSPERRNGENFAIRNKKVSRAKKVATAIMNPNSARTFFAAEIIHSECMFGQTHWSIEKRWMEINCK